VAVVEDGRRVAEREDVFRRGRGGLDVRDRREVLDLVLGGLLTMRRRTRPVNMLVVGVGVVVVGEVNVESWWTSVSRLGFRWAGGFGTWRNQCAAPLCAPVPSEWGSVMSEMSFIRDHSQEQDHRRNPVPAST
jgi:hypothetical protein